MKDIGTIALWALLGALILLCLFWYLQRSGVENKQSNVDSSIKIPPPSRNLVLTFNLEPQRADNDKSGRDEHAGGCSTCSGQKINSANNLIVLPSRRLVGVPWIPKRKAANSSTATVLPTFRFYQTTGCPACGLFKPVWNRLKLEMKDKAGFQEVFCDAGDRDKRCDYFDLSRGQKLAGFPTVTFCNEYNPNVENEEVMSFGFTPYSTFKSKAQELLKL